MARVLELEMPRLVPPTAVTHGLDAGHAGLANPRIEDASPESPDEK